MDKRKSKLENQKKTVDNGPKCSTILYRDNFKRLAGSVSTP